MNYSRRCKGRRNCLQIALSSLIWYSFIQVGNRELYIFSNYCDEIIHSIDSMTYIHIISILHYINITSHHILIRDINERMG